MDLYAEILQLRSKYSDEAIWEHYRRQGIADDDIQAAFDRSPRPENVEAAAIDEPFERRSPARMINEVEGLRSRGHSDAAIRSHFVDREGEEAAQVDAVLNELNEGARTAREELTAADVAQGFAGGLQKLAGDMIGLVGHGANIVSPGRPGQSAVETGGRIRGRGEQMVEEAIPESGAGALVVGTAESAGELVDLFLPGGAIFKGGQAASRKVSARIGEKIAKGRTGSFIEAAEKATDSFGNAFRKKAMARARREAEDQVQRGLRQVEDLESTRGEMAEQLRRQEAIAADIKETARTTFAEGKRSIAHQAESNLKTRVERLRSAFIRRGHKTAQAANKREKSVSFPPPPSKRTNPNMPAENLGAWFDQMIIEAAERNGVTGPVFDLVGPQGARGSAGLSEAHLQRILAGDMPKIPGDFLTMRHGFPTGPGLGVKAVRHGLAKATDASVAGKTQIGKAITGNYRGATFLEALDELLGGYKAEVAGVEFGMEQAARGAQMAMDLAPVQSADELANAVKLQVHDAYQAQLKMGKKPLEAVDELYRETRERLLASPPAGTADDFAARGSALIDTASESARVQAAKAAGKKVDTVKVGGKEVVAEAPAEISSRTKTRGGNFREWIARQVGDRFRGGAVAQLGEGRLWRVLRSIEDKEIRKQLQKELPVLYEQYRGAVGEMILNIRHHRGQIQSAIERSANAVDRPVAQVAEEFGKQMDAYRRTGNAYEITDTTLRDMVKAAGDDVDTMTQRYIQMGMVDEKGAELLSKGFGNYLQTSYRTFRDPQWKKSVRTNAAWDNAFKWFQDNYGRVSYNPDGTVKAINNNGMTDSEIFGVMSVIVDPDARKAVTFGKDGAANLPGIPALPQQKLTNLLKKQDVPPVIRELMGVDKDFVTNLDTTLMSMVNDLESTVFQRGMLQVGLESGMVQVKAMGDDAFTHPVRFSKLTSEDRVYYTTKEMSELIEAVDSLGPGNKSSFLQWANGVTKFGKVVFSIGAQMRNMISILPMMMQTGLHTAAHPVASGKAIKRAFRAYKTQLNTDSAVLNRALGGKRGSRVGVKGLADLSKEELNDLRFMARANLLGQGAKTGEIEQWSKQMQRAGLGPQVTKDLTGLWASSPGRFLRGYKNFMKSSYMATDDMGKHIIYQLNKGRYENMAKHIGTDRMVKHLREVTGVDVNSIGEASAEMTKNTMQHFSRSAPVGRQASRNPIFGTFVSFAIEMPRNMKNTVTYAGREYKIARRLNKQAAMAQVEGMSAKANQLRKEARLLRNDARIRAAGVASVALLFTGGTKASAQAVGLDSESEDAFRRLNPMFWMRNGDQAFENRDGHKYGVYDLGYANPYSQTVDIFRSTLTAHRRPIDETMEDIAEQMEEIFLGREIFFGTMLELAFNRRMPQRYLSMLFGKMPKDQMNVYNAEDPEAYRDAIAYFMKGVMPGDAATIDKLIQAATDMEVQQFGVKPSRETTRRRSLAREIGTIAGLPRYYEIDMAEAFGVRASQVNRRRSDMSRSFKKASSGKEGQDLLNVQSAYGDRFNLLQDEYLQMIDDARKVGVPEDVILQKMVDTNWGRERAELLMQGKKTPMSYGKKKTRKVIF